MTVIYGNPKQWRDVLMANQPAAKAKPAKAKPAKKRKAGVKNG